MINGALHHVDDLCLDQKCCAVRPVPCCRRDLLAGLGDVVRFNPRKRTRAGDAGNTGIEELVSRTGIESHGPDSGFPLAIR